MRQEKPWLQDLEELGLLVKVVPHSHNVGTHDRCKTTVEPMVKQQWFVKMDEMAKPAIEALKNGELKIRSGKLWKDLSALARETSVTGVFPDSSGGDTGSRLITARTAARSLLPKICRRNARNAAATI